MTEEDRIHWDARYAEGGPAPVGEAGPPPLLAPHEHLFPTTGTALELACGRGRGAVWLAGRGLDYLGVDISPVAVGLARALAERSGVAGRCRFQVVDLDDGLPDGPPVDVVLCYRFRDARLDRAIIDRLAPGGLLAVVVLSEVGAGPGPFRAKPGELTAAFAQLDVLAAGEGAGEAWLLARARAEASQDGSVVARGAEDPLARLGPAPAPSRGPGAVPAGRARQATRRAIEGRSSDGGRSNIPMVRRKARLTVASRSAACSTRST